MSTIKGVNCKVEVALTIATAVTLDAAAVSKGYPPVVTKTGHGFNNGACGWFVVPDGMVELDQQAFMVGAKTNDTFALPGLESTDYSDFTAGSIIMAATWGTVAESTSYEIGGGAADQQDDTRLHETKHRNLSTLLAAQDVTIGVKNQVISGAAMQYVERRAMLNKNVLMRISQGGVVLRVFYGTPSLPGESVGSGALASGQFSVSVPGWAVKPNTAAGT